MSDVPVPCATCKGTGLGIDDEICWSCHGSCVMYLTKPQYAKRIGDLNGYTSSRPYTTRELDIISRSKDPHSAYRLVVKAGFTDRNFDQIRKYRDRLKARKRRRDKREKKVDAKPSIDILTKADKGGIK